MEVLQKITRPFKAFYTVSVPLARENLGGLKELFLQKNPPLVSLRLLSVHIQGVPSISTHFQFQFLTFLIVLPKKYNLQF